MFAVTGDHETPQTQRSCARAREGVKMGEGESGRKSGGAHPRFSITNGVL
jgi:hypothetical protein